MIKISRKPRTSMSRDEHESQAGTRSAGAVAVGAVAATAAFAGGGLLTQTVLVPQWQAMDASTFLTHFRTAGPATGATLFPIEMASTGLLAAAAYRSIRHRLPGRVAWSLAAGCMVGTLLLLPVYFVQANQALLDPGFPTHEAAAELTTWRTWNWVRTGLAVMASGLACLALTARRPEHLRPVRIEHVGV